MQLVYFSAVLQKSLFLLFDDALVSRQLPVQVDIVLLNFVVSCLVRLRLSHQCLVRFRDSFALADGVGIQLLQRLNR